MWWLLSVICTGSEIGLMTTNSGDELKTTTLLQQFRGLFIHYIDSISLLGSIMSAATNPPTTTAIDFLVWTLISASSRMGALNGWSSAQLFLGDASKNDPPNDDRFPPDSQNPTSGV